MNRKYFALVLISVLITAGCETMSPETKKGATIGGVVGAAAGGIAGHQSGHGWEGALIGGAAGSVLGGVLGNHSSKQRAVNPNHLSLIEVAEMAKKGTPDDIIISEIKRTRSKYELTAEIIDYLKENGVGQKVIDYMLTNR